MVVIPRSHVRALPVCHGFNENEKSAFESKRPPDSDRNQILCNYKQQRGHMIRRYLKKKNIDIDYLSFSPPLHLPTPTTRNSICRLFSQNSRHISLRVLMLKGERSFFMDQSGAWSFFFRDELTAMVRVSKKRLDTAVQACRKPTSVAF